MDASVGVKNGVDFDSRACGCQKNRVGSFYAPAAALLDKSFIRTQVRACVLAWFVGLAGAVSMNAPGGHGELTD